MKKEDLEREIKTLLAKAPDANKIATIDAVRSFKRVVEEAKKAKSLAKMQQSLNQLKGFYK